MAVKIWGYEFFRKEPSYLKNEPVANQAISFVDRDSESTAAVIASSFTSGMFLDMQGVIKAEADLVTKYRDMCTQTEIDNAVDEISNEAITTEDDFIVKLDLSKVNIIDENAKRVLQDFHEEILEMLDFNSKAYWIFRRWYVDGRLYYHTVTDPKNLGEGIKEMRYIDPRKIREIKEVAPKKIEGGADMNQVAAVHQTKTLYYLYNDRGFAAKAPYQVGFGGMATQGVRISKDSVVHVPSGLSDTNTTMGLGYLTKSIKILSQLKTIEDSLVIYRLARAPERRVWYVDVSGLPPLKADQAVRDIMINQKNKLIYDAETGAIQDSRKFLTMTEDYWLPRRADGSGTKVETLPAGQTLGQIDDIVYFQKLLYNSLNVPIERLQSDPFDIGNSAEITRAEIKFNKFVKRLQAQFSLLFRETLKKQCVLRGIMSLEEFESIERQIRYEFAQDNHFAELKDQQILQMRAQSYDGLAQTGLIGKYYSNRWVRRNIFQQTDDDIMQMNMEIAEEMESPIYNQPSPEEQMAQDDQAHEQNMQDQEAELQQQQMSHDQEMADADMQKMAMQDQIAQKQQDREEETASTQGVLKAIGQIPKDKRTSGDTHKIRQVAARLAKVKPQKKK
jgi:hypothetical protein